MMMLILVLILIAAMMAMMTIVRMILAYHVVSFHIHTKRSPPFGVFSSDLITRWAQTALCQLRSFQYEYNFHQKVMKKDNVEQNTTYFE